MTIEEVRKCQLKQLDVLKFIDQVCKDNGLKYFVHTGTLLGAVRHHGYIPWDMDTDILMPMEDAKKLIDLVKEKNNPLFYAISENESWFSSDRLLSREAKCYGSAARNEEDQFIHIDIYSYGNGKRHPLLLHRYYSAKSRFFHRVIAWREGREEFKSSLNRAVVSIGGGDLAS